MKKIKYHEGTLDYLIIIKRKDGNAVVARFDTNMDRDDCLSFLQDRYDDCIFIAIDED